MTTATLTSEGRVTIPASVRTALGVDTRDRIESIEAGSGRFEIIAATPPATALNGMGAEPAKPVRMDATNAAIRERAKRAAVVIGLDTNVLVRHLTQDDATPPPFATRLMESLIRPQPGFASHVVLAETAWVLESCHAADAAKITEVIESLLRIGGSRAAGAA